MRSSRPLNRIKMHSPISRRRYRKYYIVTNGPFTPYFYFCGMCSMNREMGPQAHIDFPFLGLALVALPLQPLGNGKWRRLLMNPSRVIVTTYSTTLEYLITVPKAKSKGVLPFTC